MRALGLIAVLGLTLTGCVKPPPAAPFPRAASVAVGAVYDGEAAGVADAPERLDIAVEGALAARGLSVRPVGDAALLTAIAGSPSSEVRLARLAASTDAELLVLVELKPNFYAQMAGRYRWSVPLSVQVSWRDRPEGALRQTHEVPATLLYYHEREEAAVGEVAPLVARHVEAAVEAFLAREGG